MFNVGDFVVYGRNICEIKDIAIYTFGTSTATEFYVLNPIDDCKTKINVPIEQKNSPMRGIIIKSEAEKLINDIPNIDVITADNDKIIENKYKELFNSSDPRDWITIIKTTYMRNQDRITAGKKIGEKDDHYFKSAEKLLYGELSISLGKTYDETKLYVTSQVEALLK